MSGDVRREQLALSKARVAICGLGLMGGSLALALRGKCAAILGIDPDADTLDLARRMGLADELAATPEQILPQADLVVLAAPLPAILDLLADLPRHHPGAPVVLDLGSAKAAVVAAMENLPAHFDPLGGHPMCGKENGGLARAEANLYREAAFAFTPLERTTPRARGLAEQLAAVLGARPVWLAARDHDRWVAATSHVPYLVSNALASVTPLEAAPLAGPGWRGMARLAATPQSMMLGVLAANRSEVLAALNRFRQSLERLESLLASGDLPALSEALVQGAQRRDEILGGGRP